jgi:hypothetical protein
MAFWDIYYEHCSYFSLGSLVRLFEACGLEVLDAYKGFDDQYLLIEARINNQALTRGREYDDLELMADSVRAFAANWSRKLEQIKNRLQTWRSNDQRVVLWGSGSKAVAYLTMLDVSDEVEYVVDINPFKHGKYLAGTGQRIVAPEFLRQYQPDVVVLMNAIYKDEVKASLAELGLTPVLVPL